MVLKLSAVLLGLMSLVLEEECLGFLIPFVIVVMVT